MGNSLIEKTLFLVYNYAVTFRQHPGGYMAAPKVVAINPDAEVAPEVSIKPWDHITDSGQMTEDRTAGFVVATSDDQKPHMSDEAARALPFGLTSRIRHGAHVRDLAVNFLIPREVAKLLAIEKSHVAIDQGGSYKPLLPVFPDEDIYCRFSFEARVRRRGTFPIKLEYAVFVIRENQEVEVLYGAQEAQLVYLRSEQAEPSP
jgi:acyl dehydratase